MKGNKAIHRTGIFFVLLFYLFLYLPITVLITFSFNDRGFPAPWKNFSLRWYIELFESSHLWDAFYTSLIIGLSTTLLSLALGVALIFHAAQGGRVRHFLGLFFANLIIPETVLAVSLLSAYSLFSIELGYATLIVAHTVLGLGFVIPILYAKFSQIDSRLFEASLNLGASPVKTFFKITLPLLRPSIIACSLLVFIISFDDFIFSYFCSGSAIQTLPLYVLAVIRSGLSPVVNALASILLLLSSAFALLFFTLNKRSKIAF